MLMIQGPEFHAGVAIVCSILSSRQASKTASGLGWPFLDRLFLTTAAIFGRSQPGVLVLLFASRCNRRDDLHKPSRPLSALRPQTNIEGPRSSCVEPILDGARLAARQQDRKSVV